MTLPVEAQTLVSQLVTVLGLQAIRPSKIEINIDRDGIAQDVKPMLVFTRAKEKAT